MINDILKSIGNFTLQDNVLLNEKVIRRTFEKNDLLLAEGEVCNSVYFILSGAAYQFQYNDIQENIFELYTTNEWCLNATSFSGQQPSKTNIKAYKSCEVLQLTVTSIHELIAHSQTFFQLGRLLNDAVARTHYFDNMMAPYEKWKHLSETRPEIVQQFPLKFIASYLKITPETLSRVRSHI